MAPGTSWEPSRAPLPALPRLPSLCCYALVFTLLQTPPEFWSPHEPFLSARCPDASFSHTPGLQWNPPSHLAGHTHCSSEACLLTSVQFSRSLLPSLPRGCPSPGLQKGRLSALELLKLWGPSSPRGRKTKTLVRRHTSCLCHVGT